MQINIFQTVYWKVAAIPHVPVISGSSMATVTLPYMHKPSCRNLDDYCCNIIKRVVSIHLCSNVE